MFCSNGKNFLNWVVRQTVRLTGKSMVEGLGGRIRGMGGGERERGGWKNKKISQLKKYQYSHTPPS